MLEPEHGIVAIGSGGPYAQAAAQALLDNTTLPAREIVERALMIAGEICIYTNQQIVIESTHERGDAGVTRASAEAVAMCRRSTCVRDRAAPASSAWRSPRRSRAAA